MMKITYEITKIENDVEFGKRFVDGEFTSNYIRYLAIKVDLERERKLREKWVKENWPEPFSSKPGLGLKLTDITLDDTKTPSR